jgi:hypothetical protein
MRDCCAADAGAAAIKVDPPTITADPTSIASNLPRRTLTIVLSLRLSSTLQSVEECTDAVRVSNSAEEPQRNVSTRKYKELLARSQVTLSDDQDSSD